jgi:hypothetical protein
MEATYSSETSVDFQQITRRYIPQDNGRCENLQSYVKVSCLVFLTSALHEYDWSDSRSDRFTPGIGDSHWIGGLVDELTKRAILTHVGQ